MLNPLVQDAVPAYLYIARVMETMGDRIKTLREARKHTQESLAKAVGVTKSAVSQWEAGSTKNIKLETFLALLRVLRTDHEYLVYGAERAPRTGPGSRIGGV